MNTKNFKTPEEAIQFSKDIQADNVVQAWTLPDGSAIVKWIPKVTYVAHDGNECPEEIWVNGRGEPINVQDLSAEHARNIVRMVIRENREYAQSLATALTNAASFISGYTGEVEEEEFRTMPGAPTLSSILDDTPPSSGTLLN